MSIHTRIKERRLALGMNSHQALAEKIGVSWQTVQLWEKEGGTAPNRNRIEKVAEVLETTPEWLLYGDHISPSQGRKLKSVKHEPVQHIDKAKATLLTELIVLFLNMDDRGRDEILDLARSGNPAGSGVAHGEPKH